MSYISLTPRSTPPAIMLLHRIPHRFSRKVNKLCKVRVPYVYSEYLYIVRSSFLTVLFSRIATRRSSTCRVHTRRALAYPRISRILSRTPLRLSLTTYFHNPLCERRKHRANYAKASAVSENLNYFSRSPHTSSRILVFRSSWIAGIA